MTRKQQSVWNKVYQHSAVCTCSDCKEWARIEQELTEKAENMLYGQPEKKSTPVQVPNEWSDYLF